MAVVYADNVETELAVLANATDSTITVKDHTEFPTLGASDWFYVTINAETVVKVIGTAGAVFSLDAQIGTEFPVDTEVELRMCSALLNDLHNGSSGRMMFMNDITATSDFEVLIGMNGCSAGPIILDTGVTVTIPAGSTYTIV